jgi:hypothetical protein
VLLCRLKHSKITDSRQSCCRCCAGLLCEHHFVNRLTLAYLSACRLVVAALYCKLRERKHAHEAQPGEKTKAATGDAAAHSANIAVDSIEGDIAQLCCFVNARSRGVLGSCFFCRTQDRAQLTYSTVIAAFWRRASQPTPLSWHHGHARTCANHTF